MIKNNKLVLGLILFLFVLSTSVFAADYGEGRYNLGPYGVGEDSDSGGGASSGGGGGGSGSSSSSSVQSADNTLLTLSTPDDLPGDIAQSSFQLKCVTGRCSVTANEVMDLPSEIASVVYQQLGGLFVASVRLQCDGQLGEGTAHFVLEPVEGLTCDNLRVSLVEDDGTVNNVEVEECVVNDDGSLEFTVKFVGCSYLVVWQAPEGEAQPTVAPSESMEEEVVPVEVQAATEVAGGSGVWIVLLVLVIIVGLGYLFYRKKKQTSFGMHK